MPGPTPRTPERGDGGQGGAWRETTNLRRQQGEGARGWGGPGVHLAQGRAGPRGGAGGGPRSPPCPAALVHFEEVGVGLQEVEAVVHQETVERGERWGELLGGPRGLGGVPPPAVGAGWGGGGAGEAPTEHTAGSGEQQRGPSSTPWPRSTPVPPPSPVLRVGGTGHPTGRRGGRGWHRASHGPTRGPQHESPRQPGDPQFHGRDPQHPLAKPGGSQHPPLKSRGGAGGVPAPTCRRGR